MKILKLSKNDLAALAIANTKVRNVILVPCSHEGAEGAYVDYDALMDNTFLVQRDALKGFDKNDVFEYAIETTVNVSVADLTP